MEEINIRCRKCNKNISLISDQEFTFCPYCGEKNIKPSQVNKENPYTTKITELLNRAKSYLKDNDIVEAKKCLEIVLELDKDNEEARYVLSKLKETKKNKFF